MLSAAVRRHFLFLRHSLGVETMGDFRGIDWDDLLAFAERQSLVGVFFEGVRRLPAAAGPKGQCLRRWIVEAEAVRRRNIMLNAASARVCQTLRKAGFPCCILKGQGNALAYPCPHSRTPGDVDVWVDAPSRAGLRRAASALLELGGKPGEESLHHVALSLGGVEVEVHPFPAILSNPWRNVRLRRWFQAQAQSQYAHVVDFPDGVGRVPVPTLEFNLVYQLLHLFHHYFYEGIGLRQFVDYYFLLVGWNARGCGGDFPRQVASLGLAGFAGAVMWVLSEVFGLPGESMPFTPDARRGRPLLRDILEGGNFGHHSAHYSASPLAHNLQRFRRDLRLLRDYPGEALAEPPFRLWHYLWRKLGAGWASQA